MIRVELHKSVRVRHKQKKMKSGAIKRRRLGYCKEVNRCKTSNQGDKDKANGDLGEGEVLRMVVRNRS